MKNFKSYTYLLNLAQNLTEGEDDFISNCANISSLIFNNIEDLNWVGFYLWKNDRLILGPFQGQTATTRIELGEGVCGYSAKNKITYIVPDVHEFPGHIACDLLTNSEIVIPLIKEEKLIGVLDIDSPKLNRFSEEDKINLEKITTILIKNSKI